MLKRFIMLAIFSLTLFVFLASNPSTAQAGRIILKEGNDCKQDVVMDVQDTPQSYNLKRISGANDEARSLEIQGVQTGTTIRVFDSPSGSRNDDWTEIYVGRFIRSRCINSFEGESFGEATSGETTFVFDHHHKNGLDGKVSRLEVVR